VLGHPISSQNDINIIHPQNEEGGLAARRCNHESPLGMVEGQLAFDTEFLANELCDAPESKRINSG
jgi:hypothetical protein